MIALIKINLHPIKVFKNVIIIFQDAASAF